jgi:hypothetical protein
MTYSDKPCPNAMRKEGNEWVDVGAENRRKQEEVAEATRLAEEERRAAEAERVRAAQLRASLAAQAEQNPCGGSEASSACVTRVQYGDRWPYTIPGGVLACTTRFAGGYEKKDVTITHAGRTYAVNGTARGSSMFRPLDEIWRDNPNLPGTKIPDPGLIAKGLSLCK